MGNLVKKFVAAAVALTMVLGSAAFVFADTTSPVSGSDTPETTPAAAAKITKHNSTMNYDKKTATVTYKAKNAEKYKIAYRLRNGKWKYATTKKLSYTIKNLKAKGLYDIKVAGINKDGKVGKYTKIARRYMRKTGFTVRASKGTIKVTTSKMSGISGYQIRYSTNQDMSGYKTVTVKTTKALKKTIKNLKKGTYYVQVRPYKTVSGKRYVGTYQQKTKIKVK